MGWQGRIRHPRRALCASGTARIQERTRLHEGHGHRRRAADRRYRALPAQSCNPIDWGTAPGRRGVDLIDRRRYVALMVTQLLQLVEEFLAGAAIVQRVAAFWGPV